jgi:hypothetical protein
MTSLRRFSAAWILDLPGLNQNCASGRCGSVVCQSHRKVRYVGGLWRLSMSHGPKGPIVLGKQRWPIA